MRHLLVLALMTVTAVAQAHRIESLQVLREGDDYVIHLRAHIDAPPSKVFHCLADFARLPQLNPSVSRVSVGEADAEGRLPVTSEAEFCVVAICRTLKHVQRMRIEPTEAGGRIEAVTVPPPASDFRAGSARWQVSADGDASRFEFDAHLQPDLWLPPVVGPWMVQRRLDEETRRTVDNLERLSREGSP
jgi:Polyketide cyclase / dehydrase and lipid transport